VDAKARFYLEAVLAALSTGLFVLTLISRNWIEIVFGIEPDEGKAPWSGSSSRCSWSSPRYSSPSPAVTGAALRSPSDFGQSFGWLKFQVSRPIRRRPRAAPFSCGAIRGSCC
jgi:hypothetical protein